MQYLVVLLIFAVFLQTRMMDLRRSVYCLAMQSGIIACACVASGASEQGLAHVILPGVLTLGVKVMFIPWAMLRLIGKLTDENELRFDTNVNYSTIAAAVFLVLGYLLVDRLMPGAFGRDVIAASILMIMTGLSLMVMRKRAIMQMCGLITLENGIYLLGLRRFSGCFNSGSGVSDFNQPNEFIIYDDRYYGYAQIERIKKKQWKIFFP